MAYEELNNAVPDLINNWEVCEHSSATWDEDLRDVLQMDLTLRGQTYHFKCLLQRQAN